MSSCRLQLPGLAALKALVLVAFLSGVAACATTGNRTEAESEEGGQSYGTSSEDPFEDFNRKIFSFNYRLDQWVLRPLALGYTNVTPRPVRTGVTNFFGNLLDLTSSANSALQWKWSDAGNDGGRFLLNSTVGLLGLVDVASKAGLPRREGEDFGQTLAVWGVGSGPYLMLPFFGPATMRDGAGRIVDAYTDPAFYLDPRSAQYALHAVDIIDDRAQLLQTDSLLTGDSYVLVRDFYLQRRNYLINDGDVEDDFGAGGFGDDDFYYDDGYDLDSYDSSSDDGYGGGYGSGGDDLDRYDTDTNTDSDTLSGDDYEGSE